MLALALGESRPSSTPVLPSSARAGHAHHTTRLDQILAGLGGSAVTFFIKATFKGVDEPARKKAKSGRKAIRACDQCRTAKNNGSVRDLSVFNSTTCREGCKRYQDNGKTCTYKKCKCDECKSTLAASAAAAPPPDDVELGLIPTTMGSTPDGPLGSVTPAPAPDADAGMAATATAAGGLNPSPTTAGSFMYLGALGDVELDDGAEASPLRVSDLAPSSPLPPATTTPEAGSAPLPVLRERIDNLRAGVKQMGYTPLRVEQSGEIDDDYGSDDAAADSRASARVDAKDEETFDDHTSR